MARLSVAAAVFLLIFFADMQFLNGDPEPTISASPAVLPYGNAPDMSSFFPSPNAQWPDSSAASPDSEAFAPAPVSGEFIGKNSSSSIKFSAFNGFLIVLEFCFLFAIISVF